MAMTLAMLAVTAFVALIFVGVIVGKWEGK